MTRLDTDCKIDPRLFEFKKNKFGKPEVRVYKLTFTLQSRGRIILLLFVTMFDQILWRSDDDRTEWPLHFNISHTSSLIACGVTMGVPVCLFL